MCAINGYLKLTHPDSPPEGDDYRIRRMNAATRRRGPDGSSHYADESIALGHNLLSISGDPDHSSQPIKSRKGNYLVYNGELFDIEGYDTQYLCDMLDHYGIDYLKNVNAHFALAWYEPKVNRLTIARDHFCVKPLFYYQRDCELAFSSSIHGLMSYAPLVIDPEKHNFLHNNLGYLMGKMTMYRDTYSLMGGEYITFDTKTTKEIRRGWLHDYQLQRIPKTDEEIKNLIVDSIRMVANTKQKFAVSVSGGLDSTTIAAVLKDRDPVFITGKYEEREEKNTYDRDWEYANAFYRHINKPLMLVDMNKDKCERYEKRTSIAPLHLLQDLDRQIPRHIVADVAHQTGCKVLISGDGADEIFTGYTSHTQLYDKAGHEQEKIFNDALAEWRKNERYYGRFPEHVFGPDAINNYLFLDLFCKVNTYNISNDAHAGWYGVESRAPFLLQKLVRTMMNIPSEMKLRKMKEVKLSQIGNTKYYLRKLFQDHLPEKVWRRHMKSGFSLPYNSFDYSYGQTRRNKQMRLIRSEISSIKTRAYG